MSSIVRITEAEASREPVLAVAKAMAARERWDVVECPWWFTYLAMSHPKFRKTDQRADAINDRIQEALR